MSQHDMLQQNKQIGGSSAECLRVLDFASKAPDVSSDQLFVYSCGNSAHMNLTKF